MMIPISPMIRKGRLDGSRWSCSPEAHRGEVPAVMKNTRAMLSPVKTRRRGQRQAHHPGKTQKRPVPLLIG
jgi:hypothetical protein